ncbi:reverse transcriptase domain-containing protein [Tanacetum coccineum]
MDRIKNIDGKILGKNGKPLKAATSGVPLRKPSEVPGDKGEASSENLFDASSAKHANEDEHEHEHAGWEDLKFHAKKNTFVSVVASEPPKKKHKFANSLVGYFVGKSVAFTLVENYVTNTWAKFGFQKVIKDEDGFFFFRFASTKGLEQVIEQGPWLIRNTPLILNKWTPNLALKKDEITKVPVWVKMHKVHVIAYSEDGLSLIATQIGKPIMLDAFTSSMCEDPWGRPGYARALIEVSADKPLKKDVIMAVPEEDGTGHTLEKICLEYEWKPPVCMDCHVFGHSQEQCPKRVKEQATETKTIDNDRFTIVHKKKKKGKIIQKWQPRGIEGIKLNKPRPSFSYTNPSKPSTSKPLKTPVATKNQFDALGNQGDNGIEDTIVSDVNVVN